MDINAEYAKENSLTGSTTTTRTNLLDCYRIALDFGLQAAQQAYENVLPSDKYHTNPFNVSKP